MNTSAQNITLVIGHTMLEFQHGLTATHVDEELDVHGVVVRYLQHSENLNRPERGVYMITIDNDPVYFGKYETSFSKRWLYSNLNMIYHHKRKAIADSLLAGKIVEVYVITEDALRESIKTDDGAESVWINVSGVERTLIDMLKPAWNETHKSQSFVHEDRIRIDYIDGPSPEERHLAQEGLEPGDCPVYVFGHIDDDYSEEELAQMQAIIGQMPSDELHELNDIISRLLTDDLRQRSGRDFVRNHPLLKFSFKDNGIVTYRLLEMRRLWDER
ncbi:MAG: hypothetical protein ACK5GI_04015 [Ignavibacteria bacterium]